MARKKISVYENIESQSSPASDSLVVEVGSRYAALLTQLPESRQPGAFELFEWDEPIAPDEMLVELQLHSLLLERPCADTRLYVNFPESVVTPSALFTAGAADDYLELVHGPSIGGKTKCDLIHTDPGMVNIYRLPSSFHESMEGMLGDVQTSHTQSRIIEQVMRHPQAGGPCFISLTCYHQYMVMAVVCHGSLQIIRSFGVSRTEDMIYHVQNTVQQLGLLPAETHFLVSGMIGDRSVFFRYLRNMYAKVSFDETQAHAPFRELLSDYPAHYFLPFLNLLG